MSFGVLNHVGRVILRANNIFSKVTVLFVSVKKRSQFYLFHSEKRSQFYLFHSGKRVTVLFVPLNKKVTVIFVLGLYFLEFTRISSNSAY